MKIFLAGSVSSATDNHVAKYEIYNKVILSSLPKVTLVTPDDICNFRNSCITKNPNFSKLQIDKSMVDYDLCQVRESDLVVCDISEQSSGMGLELGICKENNIKTIFCFQKGSYVSSMIYGAFNESPFIEYENMEELGAKLASAIETLNHSS